MINNLFIFPLALFLVIRGATMATKYAGYLAESYNLSRYTIGFIVVAVISILPEGFISINSALENVPSFGLGMLFGSNIADLTLVFAVIIAISNRGIAIESKILKNRIIYPFLLMMPLILGANGYYSRAEGLALILAGSAFYYFSFRDGKDDSVIAVKERGKQYINLLMLLFSMAIMLVGAHFTVTSATALADYIGISPILIGMLIVGLGTTLPELFFSLKAVEKDDDSLAVGDILGTVLADATILVGIIATISPFYFPVKIVYVTGLFMVGASVILLYFMNTGRRLSRKESYALFAFWLLFVLVEFTVNK